MKSGKIKIAVAAVFIVTILTMAPAFLAGSLRTRSITMTVGDSAHIEFTNPILQLVAKYDVADGNIVTAEDGGLVEAYGPGETEVRVSVPFRKMSCKVNILGFEEGDTVLFTGQTVKPGIAGASPEAEFHSSDESVVDVVDGNLVALADGDSTIECIDKGLSVYQTVHVAGIVSDRPYLFAGNQMQMRTNEEITGVPTGWRVDDPSVASIDGKGVITGLKAGTAVVSCNTADNQTLETAVNVVGLKDPDLFLQLGEVYESPLTSGQGFDAAGIEWASDNSEVLRVDTSGNIKAVSGGEANIMCSIDGQEISGKVHVMTLPDQAFTAVGMDSVLQVANAGDNEVTWQSSDESKVKVENGVLKGVGEGAATITAMANDKTFSCNVSVVKFSTSAVNLTMGKTDEEPTVVEVDGLDTQTGREEQTAEWSSQDETIAKVDNTGAVTPVSAGSTMLLCSIGPSTMSIPVTITEEDIENPEEADGDAGADGTEGTEASPEPGEPEESAQNVSEPEKTQEKPAEKAEPEKKKEEKKTVSKNKSSGGKKSTQKTTPIPEPKKVARTSGQLSGAEAIIACGNYYNKVLESAVERGEKWVYSNSSKYVSQNQGFDTMLKGKIRGGNCASIANWAFQDMGITKKGNLFYGNSSGKIQNYHTGSKKLKSTLDAACDVINVEKQNKSFGTLVNEGKVQVGDVIIGKGHTFIYRGNGTVFASGHDAKWHKDRSVKTDDSNKAVFESWIRKYKGTYDERFKVHFIIRVKDSFVPKYYRDGDGNLVSNR